LGCAVLTLAIAGGSAGGLAAFAGAQSSSQAPADPASLQRPIGCTDPGAALRFNGHRNQKRVALTFDDGPSSYTPAFLRVLRRTQTVATFFEIGEQVRGHSKLLKQILDQGSEIGNHTMHHAFRGKGDLAETNRVIKRDSGFTPCLMRPPDGALVGGLVSAAHALHMTTVVWDVDPRDWSTPGSGAIYANVTGHARSGSIAVMHDGGGNRSQTLAALPRIIKNLRHRGYKLVTVTELLGGEFIYPQPQQPAQPPSA